MIHLAKEKSEEYPVHWDVNFRAWQSRMAIDPSNEEADILTFASGVDGRYEGALRRYQGHRLLEDPRRQPMLPFTGESVVGLQWGLHGVVFSAEKTAEILEAGNSVLLDMEAFEITAHDRSRPDRKIKGWVCRLEPSALRRATLYLESSPLDLRYLEDVPAQDIGWRSTDPVLAILVYDPTSEPEHSKLRFVLPMTPTRVQPFDFESEGPPLNPGDDLYYQWLYSFPNTLHHYFDPWIPLESDGFSLWDTYSSPIHLADPIKVTSNERFVYVWSSTSEIDPLVLWHDQQFGNLSPPDDGDLTARHVVGMSVRSPGWHWEWLGVRLPEPTLTSDDVRPGEEEVGMPYDGLALGGSYGVAYRWIDSYRGRYTRRSPIIQHAALLDQTIQIEFPIPEAYADKQELALFYDRYQVYSSLSQAGKGGTLYSADTMRANKPIDENGILSRFWWLNWMNDDWAGEGSPIIGDRKNSVVTYFDGDRREGDWEVQDVTPTTDIYLSVVGNKYDVSEEDPGTTPTEVLAATSFQGLTVVATAYQQSIPEDPETPEQSLSAEFQPSAKVALRWSATHTYAPEIFPDVNVKQTSLSTEGPVAFIRAGNYLYCFGNGAILRGERTGAGMAWTEIGSGFQLAGSRAVVEIKGMIIALFKDGARALEPNTGALTEIPHLDFLLTEVWEDLSNVSLAYDAVLDALYIAHPESETVAILWIKRQRLSMLEGCPVYRVFPLELDTFQRVVLVMRTGRMVVPSDTEDGSYCMDGRSLYESGSPAEFAAKVVSADYSSLNDTTLVTFEPDWWIKNSYRDYLQRRVDTDPQETSAVDFYWYDSSVYVATGTYTGERLKVSHWQNITEGGGQTYLAVKGDATDVLEAGEWLAFDPIPFGVMAGPLGTVDGTDALQKREVTQVGVICPKLTEPSGQDGSALFQTGAYPYFRLAEDGWVPKPDATDQQNRYWTVSPRPDKRWSAKYPLHSVNYLGGYGQLMFPFARTYWTDLRFTIRDLICRGKLSPSDNIGG
jgi:hypothetical protein